MWSGFSLRLEKSEPGFWSKGEEEELLPVAEEEEDFVLLVLDLRRASRLDARRTSFRALVYSPSPAVSDMMCYCERWWLKIAVLSASSCCNDC